MFPLWFENKYLNIQNTIKDQITLNEHSINVTVEMFVQNFKVLFTLLHFSFKKHNLCYGSSCLLYSGVFSRRKRRLSKTL